MIVMFRENMTTPMHILNYYEWMMIWDNEEAVQNAKLIADQCNVTLEKAEMVHPDKTHTLLELCYEGASKKNIDLSSSIYLERLEREIKMILEKKIEDYFYLVADLCKFARANMLVGPARGSSCGSLVCYLLDITDIDPIPYNLLFERFIDVNRIDYPDIDIDFPDDRREMVFDYLKEKYGRDQVVRLGTVMQYKAKSAITDIAKNLKIPAWEVNDLKNAIIERSTGDARAQFCILDTFEQLEIGKKTIAKYPELKVAAQIEGHARQKGQHAAGMIVTAHPVSWYCSVDEQTGSAQIDKYDSEFLNLLKIDALGLRTLSILQDTIDQIGWPREKLMHYPTEDVKAFQLLNESKFAGIFQFEGFALQSLCKQMTVETLEDMVALTAIARPGPLNSGGSMEFLLRRMGKHEVIYLHSRTEEMTRLTYGVIIYQEQVMQIAREVGDLSWEDVSSLRKAMSRSLGKEFFDTFWEKFKIGALKNGVKEEEAQAIWNSINTMGSWAFNRSHAVAYGIISYWCCVLKAHFPQEFAASCLRNIKDEAQSLKILRELDKEGFKYKSYDKDLSEVNWSVKDGLLIGGLIGIKGIGEKMATAILAKRASREPLTPRQINLLTNGVTPYDTISEARDKWGHIFDTPAKYNIHSPLTLIANIEQNKEGEFVFIAKLAAKNLRDHNELMNIQKRGYTMTGQTKYLNLTFEDDTGTINGTINRKNYLNLGLPLVETGKIGDWYLWKGYMQQGFHRIYVQKLKKLTGNVDYLL
jgi:DNA-directed DNA polymerase III PolC